VPPRRLATQAAKQLRAFTHAGGAARAAAMLDRAPRSTSATVAIPILPFFCFFVKYDQKLNWSQITTKIKVIQNFTNYKSSFGDQSQFWVENDEFDKTV
jgi:hypothetical protein